MIWHYYSTWTDTSKYNSAMRMGRGAEGIRPSQSQRYISSHRNSRSFDPASPTSSTTLECLPVQEVQLSKPFRESHPNIPCHLSGHRWLPRNTTYSGAATEVANAGKVQPVKHVVISLFQSNLWSERSFDNTSTWCRLRCNSAQQSKRVTMSPS